MSRKRILLLLFVSLGVALIYAWLETPRQQRVSPAQQTATGSSRSASEARQQGRQSGIGLDFSGGAKRSYNKPKRDLFRALYRPANPGKPIVVAPPIAVPEPEEEPIVIAVVPLNRPAAQPRLAFKPIPPLKILGYLQKGSSQSVFLSSVQGEIYVVKRGDRFADGLLVRELNARQIVISRGLKDPGVTLPLREGDAELTATKSYAPQRSTVQRMNVPPMEIMSPQPPVSIERPPSIDGETTVDP